jgi:Fe-S-cluster-containing dehydrogenase component
MSISRRDLLKGAAVAGAAVAIPVAAEARKPVPERPDAVGMLFDATQCVGCRACQSACKQSNKLAPDKTEIQGGLYDAPRDLNGTTKNIIKAFGDPASSTYMKQQCMHCVDPSCVSVCMMGALHKEGEGKRDMGGEVKGSGIVRYDRGLCVGCRYCQIGCAFNVPKFEWYEAFPLIVKCELCNHRRDEKLQKSDPKNPLAVANPACCEVCPREAVIFGKRDELLAEAKRRVQASPGKYEAKVYGEHDGGGTQVLYLAPKGVTFNQLGLPVLEEESSAAFSEHASHAPYLGGLTPVALYAGLWFAIRRNKQKEEAADHGHGHEEGK